MTDEVYEAHRILDLAKAGKDIPVSTLMWCLFLTGDLLGLALFDRSSHGL